MGVVDMSMPERWGVLQFADERVNVAMAVHNAQQAFSGGAQQSTGSATREWGYAATIKELLPHAPPRALDAGCTGAIALKLYGNRTAPAGVCNTFAGSGGVAGHGPPSRSCPSYCAEVDVGDVRALGPVPDHREGRQLLPAALARAKLLRARLLRGPEHRRPRVLRPRAMRLVHVVVAAMKRYCAFRISRWCRPKPCLPAARSLAALAVCHATTLPLNNHFKRQRGLLDLVVL
eukprot:COSAG04_NODE_5928_length_1453_cov_1.381832_2_plen_233_part_00